MKLYNVPETSQVGMLVNEIEEAAKSKGLTLSRWQANGGSHAVSITYIVHSGERAGQARYQPEDSIVSMERLSTLEGTTSRCNAYKSLSRMLREIS